MEHVLWIIEHVLWTIEHVEWTIGHALLSIEHQPCKQMCALVRMSNFHNLEWKSCGLARSWFCCFHCEAVCRLNKIKFLFVLTHETPYCICPM